MMNSPKSVLDKKRKDLITKALKLYSPADICIAIRGCSKSPYHMGDNATNAKYNGLGLILRSAEYIDKFMALDAGTARSSTETIAEKNARITAEFLGMDAEDENTIEMEKS